MSLYRLWKALRQLAPMLTEFSTPKAGLLGSLAAFFCRVPRRIYFLRGLRFETEHGLKRVLLKAMEQLASACAHAVVCNSESLRRQAFVLGVAREEKLHVIAAGSSNGVDTNRFAPGPDTVRRRVGIAARAPVVGYVGRLTRDKGILDLLEAFNRLLLDYPTAVLLLVGWFDESADALTVFQRARIEAHPRIVCTGFVPDTAAYYRAMDLLVLPTWREGFPNVALEAAASEVPVITTLTTGARDSVLTGVTGLLVPPGDPCTLALAMSTLLRYPRTRRRMGQEAREWVLQEFVNRRVLGLTVSFYRKLVREAGGEDSARSIVDEQIIAEVKDVAAVAD